MTLHRRLRRTLQRGAAALTDVQRTAATACLDRLQTANGTFVGRDGREDIYYASFAVDCCIALGRPLPEGLPVWLDSLGDGRDLDIPHAVALVRAWAAVEADDASAALCQRFAAVLMRRPAGTYEAFLLLLAAEALGAESSETVSPQVAEQPPVAPTEAARLLLADAFERDADDAWLRECWAPEGGCRVFAEAPFADLLSTAVAAFALAPDLPVPPAALADFVQQLWDPAGVFRPSAIGDEGDCEYLWYGLLALGSAELSRPREAAPQG